MKDTQSTREIHIVSVLCILWIYCDYCARMTTIYSVWYKMCTKVKKVRIFLQKSVDNRIFACYHRQVVSWEAGLKSLSDGLVKTLLKNYFKGFSILWKKKMKKTLKKIKKVLDKVKNWWYNIKAVSETAKIVHWKINSAEFLSNRF